MMSNKRHMVTVAIPLYRKTLPELELNIVRHNLEVLKRHHICFVVPLSLELDELDKQLNINHYEILRVSDFWLGSSHGIEGYNTMMLDSRFYELFSDSDYLLVCQSDAYIFRDELELWCAKGYDYVGAPWPVLPEQRFKKWTKWVLHKFRPHETIYSKSDILYKVGNGGLSLRKVDSHIAAAKKYKNIALRMLAQPHHLHNEDVFWALTPREFRYPRFREALHFSIDMYPEHCMRLNDGVQPFGCHGLTNPETWEYWKGQLFG